MLPFLKTKQCLVKLYQHISQQRWQITSWSLEKESAVSLFQRILTSATMPWQKSTCNTWSLDGLSSTLPPSLQRIKQGVNINYFTATLYLGCYCLNTIPTCNNHIWSLLIGKHFFFLNQPHFFPLFLPQIFSSWNLTHAVLVTYYLCQQPLYSRLLQVNQKRCNCLKQVGKKIAKLIKINK